MILVNEKDCIGAKKYLERIHKTHIKTGGGDNVFKKIDNRDRKRCHNCGHDYGSWYEYLDKGRLEYRFLCRDCIDKIESR